VHLAVDELAAHVELLGQCADRVGTSGSGNPSFFIDIMPDTPVETVTGTLCRGG
jgi:hypothetical protein